MNLWQNVRFRKTQLFASENQLIFEKVDTFNPC